MRKLRRSWGGLRCEQAIGDWISGSGFGDCSGHAGVECGGAWWAVAAAGSGDPHGDRNAYGGVVDGRGDLDALTERRGGDGKQYANGAAERDAGIGDTAGADAGCADPSTYLDTEAVMSEEELEQILNRLRERRLFDEIFVLVVERQGKRLKLVDYGMKEIGDIAAWIAVQNHEKEREG